MHYANAEKNDRLKSIVSALIAHGELSTIQIQDMVRGCSVSTSISEINAFYRARLSARAITHRQAGKVHYYQIADIFFTAK